MYVNSQEILSWANHSIKTWSIKTFFGVGTSEMGLYNCDQNNVDNKMAMNNIRHFISIIQEQLPDSKIHFEVTECATHSFKSASRRLPVAIQFLFGVE